MAKTTLTAEERKRLSARDERRMGKCNCNSCRRKRADAYFKGLLKKAYPGLTFLPRYYNKDNNYDGNRELRNIKANVRNLYVFKAIVKLRQRNNKIRQKLAKQGGRVSDRTFCVHCGKIHLIKDGKKVYTNVGLGTIQLSCVCADCVKQFYTKCANCDNYERTGTMMHVFHDMNHIDNYQNGIDIPDNAWAYVCRECSTKNYKPCTSCGIRVRKDELVDVTQYSRGNRFQANPILFCPFCKKDKVRKCPDCGEFYLSHQGQRLVDEDGISRRVCWDCYNANTPIKAHDYRPSKFRKIISEHESKLIPEDKLLYGFEIEVENMGSPNKYGDFEPQYSRLELAQKIQNYMDGKFGKNAAYIVHDGTLRAGHDIGLEIVTQPVSWQKYKDDHNLYTDLLKQLRLWGCQAYRPGTAGFHAHMSKASFTRLHLYKFVDFLYKRSVADFRQAIAQRKGNRYSNFSNQDLQNTKKIAKDKYNPSGSHYAAINLTNPDTVEVRIFRGVLEPLHFHKNIEFLHALYRFARDSRLQDMVVYNFIKYIVSNKNEYKCLLEFIKDNVAINARYTSVQKLLKG